MGKPLPLIAGNWKMNKSVAEALALVTEIKEKIAGLEGVEVAIAPPFTALYSVAQALKESRIGLAAQNVFWETAGAFTGEISPAMLHDVGCHYAITGHSERRQYFGETNETVSRRVRAVLKAGMLPIVCVGETLAEREAGQTMKVLDRQVKESLGSVNSSGDASKLVIAYEPVWAIGTGKVATVEQAQEAHAFIRSLLVSLFSKDVAAGLRILYGGSVKPENASQLLAQSDINGALVGGASLKANDFVPIIKSAIGR